MTTSTASCSTTGHRTSRSATTCAPPRRTPTTGCSSAVARRSSWTTTRSPRRSQRNTATTTTATPPPNVTFTNNVFSSGLPDLNPGQPISGTFSESNNLCNSHCSGSHDMNGTPTYVNGASATTYDGFGLTTNSMGHAAATDGSDIGIAAAVRTPPTTTDHHHDHHRRRHPPPRPRPPRRRHPPRRPRPPRRRRHPPRRPPPPHRRPPPPTTTTPPPPPRRPPPRRRPRRRRPTTTTPPSSTTAPAPTPSPTTTTTTASPPSDYGDAAGAWDRPPGTGDLAHGSGGRSAVQLVAQVQRQGDDERHVGHAGRILARRQEARERQQRPIPVHVERPVGNQLRGAHRGRPGVRRIGAGRLGRGRRISHAVSQHGPCGACHALRNECTHDARPGRDHREDGGARRPRCDGDARQLYRASGHRGAATPSHGCHRRIVRPALAGWTVHRASHLVASAGLRRPRRPRRGMPGPRPNGAMMTIAASHRIIVADGDRERDRAARAGKEPLHDRRPKRLDRHRHVARRCAHRT